MKGARRLRDLQEKRKRRMRENAVEMVNEAEEVLEGIKRRQCDYSHDYPEVIESVIHHVESSISVLKGELRRYFEKKEGRKAVSKEILHGEGGGLFRG
jgi:predicted metal-dependent hydrolase